VSRPVALGKHNLPAIERLDVPVPRYERADLQPRIVHVGVGGFHRSHMARYTEETAAAGGTWGIRGVGLLETDARLAGILRSQDYLYTLIERDGDGSKPRVVGSIVDFCFLAGSGDRFARLIAAPDIAILSLTITEGGYSLARPNPTIEAIVSALDARRRAGSGPLTILSCDNLPGNGDAARHAVMTLAEARSVELRDYVEHGCAFPNSMVDRITPQTTEADRTWLREEVGIDDGWPVVCESFRQWVIEDRFAAGRPRWEDVGVLFTDDVHAWELYKLRMLNAGHSCLAYLAALAGIVYVDEAVTTPPIRRYLETFLAAEAIPTLREIPGHPAAEYAATVIGRLDNTGVRDQVARLCIDGTAKFPSFLIPTVEAQLERGGPVDSAALALAAWRRYLATVPDEERAPDSRGESAVALARESDDDPLKFLALDSVFSAPLRESTRFRDAFARASRDLATVGPLQAIDRTLERVEHDLSGARP
jgi:mannitol 2-dehydrogenase